MSDACLPRPGGFRAFLLGLCLAVAAAVSAEPSPADLPGSATLAPKPLHSPPPPPLAGKATAHAELGVWIREDGSVDEVTVLRCPEEWRAPVVDTVRQWRFEPVKWEGRTIPARVGVSFQQVNSKEVWATFSAVPNLPGELHTATKQKTEFGLVAPVLQADPNVVLPLCARITAKPQAVSLQYVIEDDGTTGRFVPLAASSEPLLRATLDLVAARRYAPATIRGIPVAVACDQDVPFVGLSRPIEGLDGVTEVDDPVYPYDRVLAGDEGSAKVKFTLAADGTVAGTEVLEASHPDFGGALVAAVETWRFKPEAAAAQAERIFEYDFAFSRLANGARRLAEQLRAGNAVSKSAAGLDARPKLLARPPLIYPHALFAEGVEGRAEIECIVDRAGLAFLPRVVGASRPEFGWAAAAFVGGMRFAPITRGGKPTELRITLPVKFTPPAPAAAPAPPAAPAAG